jgi:acyl-CoA thioester hydrolase
LPGTFETFRGVAHPWLCDAFGHLNTRHHMAMFDDAGFHFLHLLVAAAGEAPSPQLGWADVSLKVALRAEVPLGALVVIRTELLGLGRTSTTYRHEMRAADDDRLHSECECVTVRFDLDARKAAPLPAGLAEATRGWIG